MKPVLGKHGVELPVNIDELYLSGRQLSDTINGMQILVKSGFAPEDVADAYYSSARVITALTDGDLLHAKNLTISMIVEALDEIKASHIEEERLWVLTEAGLAVGEISWAVRNIIGFRENMLHLHLAELQERADLTYEFFRTDRPTRRITRTTRWELSTSGSWFEHYSKIISRVEAWFGHYEKAAGGDSRLRP